MTPQQQADAGGDEMEEEEEEEEEEKGLFEWLAKKEKSPEEKANRLAAEWTTRYQEDQGFCGGGNVYVVNECERLQGENLQAGVDELPSVRLL